MAARASEDDLLRWLRRRLRPPAGATGTSQPPELIGDDAAVLPREAWAVTVDSQIAGVHVPPDLPAAVLARRLLAVNLSDLAATGAEPAYALLALSATTGFDHRAFFRALLAACRTAGLELAGGDLARHPAATTATLTLFGRRPPGGRWLRRSAGRPGDVLWLGGTVGESAAGCRLLARGARWPGAIGASGAKGAGGARTRVELPPDLPAALGPAARRAVRRHLAPAPQLALGRWLGRQRRAAALDVSDGPARDLRRLAGESGVGAEVTAEALPLAAGFERLCGFLGVSALELALGGGEDYVLLFALPAGTAPPPAFGCREIGRLTRSRNLVLIDDGCRRPLPELGWDHLQGG